jgi:hypothetical protein
VCSEFWYGYSRSISRVVKQGAVCIVVRQNWWWVLLCFALLCFVLFIQVSDFDRWFVTTVIPAGVVVEKLSQRLSTIYIFNRRLRVITSLFEDGCRGQGESFTGTYVRRVKYCNARRSNPKIKFKLTFKNLVPRNFASFEFIDVDSTTCSHHRLVFTSLGT